MLKEVEWVGVTLIYSRFINICVVARSSILHLHPNHSMTTTLQKLHIMVMEEVYV